DLLRGRRCAAARARRRFGAIEAGPDPDRRRPGARAGAALADLYRHGDRPDLFRDHSAQGQRRLRRGQFPRPVRVDRARPDPTRRPGAVLIRLGQLAAQLGLEHLAVIVFGESIDKAVFARSLEAGDVLEAEPVERRFGDFGAGPGHDKGDDLLAPIRVRASNDRGLDQIGVAQQHLLDLARIDVAAAGNDHVLRAVAQGQKAVLVDAAEIAGVQPAAAQGLGIGLGVLPITLHDAIALRDALADLARLYFLVL